MAESRGEPRRNLVAVPSEASRSAAQEPAPGRTPGAAAPRSAADAAAPAETTPARSRRETWLLAILAVAAVVAAAQTWRLSASAEREAALSDQVIGLEAQLAAAHTQLHTYEMQRSQIRDSVSDIAERVMLLSELVGGESQLSGAPAP